MSTEFQHLQHQLDQVEKALRNERRQTTPSQARIQELRQKLLFVTDWSRSSLKVN